jgi:predicted PurR-regulated permease PerM/CheY-like chemotaxis protein
MRPRSQADNALFILATMAVLVALYFGRDVLIPFALALLISFLLTPPVNLLERLRLGKVMPVVIVLLVAYCAAGGIIYICAQQFSNILEGLPEYQYNLRSKIQRIENPASSSKLKRAVDSLKALATEAAPDSSTYEKQKALRKSGKRGPEPETPVPVEVVKPSTGILGSMGLLGGSAARLIGTLFGVVVLSLFMLLRREDLRDRIFRLFGQGRISLVTTALNDAARRVSRYLFSQFCVNTVFGTLLGTGLYFIGVPYPVFWGGLGALLRFIPYVGTVIAAACPFIMALAVSDGWKVPLLTLGLWAVVEVIISGALEPWLYAERAGISSLAVLISAAFWTTLWGPVGLILATPLTVCLVVLGRHVPQFEFVYILFGDEPTLSPEAGYYQRMLAGKEQSARDLIEEFMEGKTQRELYDEVLIPALLMMEKDRHEGAVEPERERSIFRSTRELIEDFASEAPEPVEQRIGPRGQISIMIVSVRDEADELAGLMLGEILERNGYRAKTVPPNVVSELVRAIESEHPDIVFISSIPPYAVSHTRSICRRLRQGMPEVIPITCLWGAGDDIEHSQGKIKAGCSDHVITTIEQAEVQLHLLYPRDDRDREEAAAVANQSETEPVNASQGD